MSKENSNSECTATPKEIRQHCKNRFSPQSDETCANCTYFERGSRWKVPQFTRGGETREQSEEWRNIKSKYGIPHGDS